MNTQKSWGSRTLTLFEQGEAKASESKDNSRTQSKAAQSAAQSKAKSQEQVLHGSNEYQAGAQVRDALYCSNIFSANRKRLNDKSAKRKSVLPTNPQANSPTNPMNRSTETEHPWSTPRTVFGQTEHQTFQQLKDRLAQIPSRSKQKRQHLFVDLWTGQHWLELTLSGPEKHGILKPVSIDTAISIATVGSFRMVNQQAPFSARP